MPSVQGSRTEQNLLTAFLEESADQNRYLYFAKVAKKEGYIAISSAFEETAMQERSHAKNFFKHLGEGELVLNTSFNMGRIGTTMENLTQSVRAERRQYEILYAGFEAIARDEGLLQIGRLFHSIAVAEKYHAAKFQSFIDAIEKEAIFNNDESTSWVCTKCGYVHHGKSALEKCPACGHPKAYFERTTLL